MSLSTWIGYFRSKNKARGRSRKNANRTARLGFCAGGIRSMEPLEMRAMLSAVVIDRSSDPSADTIAVTTSGLDTLVSVNGTNVYTGASASISSLSITGTNYDDTISFDFTGGNPVPDGTISADGGGGTNALSATAGANMELNDSSLTVDTTEIASITTANITEATLNTAQSGSVLVTTVNGWEGTATLNLNDAGTFAYLYALSGSSANTFSSNPSASTLSGTGYNYTTIGSGYVTAYSYGLAGDAAYLNDNGSSGHATLGVGGATLGGPNYQDTAYNFPNVTITSDNSADTATMDDSQMGGSFTFVSHPTFSTMQGGSFDWKTVGFSSSQLYARYSSDVGYIDDLNSGGNAVLNAQPGDAAMQAGSVHNSLYAAEMTAQSFYGNSTAYLDDSSTQAGTLYAHPQSSTFEGTGYSMSVQQFSSVTFTAHNSSDTAYLDDNGASGASNFFSAASNDFWAGATPYKNYTYSAVGFGTVYSVAYNANDYASIYDESGGATLSYNSGVVMAYGSGVTVSLVGFGGYNNQHITANASAPAGTYDYAHTAALPYVVFNGNWTFI